MSSVELLESVLDDFHFPYTFGGAPFLDSTTSHSSAESVRILNIFCKSQHCSE